MNKSAIFFLSLIMGLGFLAKVSTVSAEDEVVYCGMPAITSPTSNSTASGWLTIEAKNDAVTTPETPWTIPAGTTTQLWFKIVPAGQSLGDSSNASDPLIHKWGFSDLGNVRAQTDISGYSNGNYTLGVRVSYYCATSGDHVMSYWPSYVDWQKIPITISNSSASSSSGSRTATPASSSTPAAQNLVATPAVSPTTTSSDQSNQKLETAITSLAEKQIIVEALKAAPISNTHKVEIPVVDKQAKKITFSGKVESKGTVYLYILSDPKVAEVATDDKGNWTYDFTGLIEAGKHLVYSATKDVNGNIVAKSSPVSFEVESAYASGIKEIANSGTITVEKWVFYAISLITLGALASVLLLTRKKKSLT